MIHTARWPRENVDLDGKDDAGNGTGATGIQVIQTIASEVELLKVFIRTPQFTLPMKNPSYTEADVKAYHDRFEHIRDAVGTTVAGFEYDFTHDWAALSEAQRLQVLEDGYAAGSLKLWLADFVAMFRSGKRRVEKGGVVPC